MTLGEGVSVIAVLRCHPAVTADAVQLLLRVRVTPLGVCIQIRVCSQPFYEKKIRPMALDWDLPRPAIYT